MRSGMKMMATAFATLLAMVFTTVPARAQEDKWQFEITPYLWAAGFKGDVTVQGRTASIDKSFNDLLQYVDTAGSVMGRVQYGQWVLWGQADYMDLSDDLNTASRREAGVGNDDHDGGSRISVRRLEGGADL